MADKTMREKLIQFVTDYKDVAERNALAETPEESADYLLALLEIGECREDEGELSVCPCWLQASQGERMGKEHGKVTMVFRVNQQRLDEACQSLSDTVLELASDTKLGEVASQIQQRLK